MKILASVFLLIAFAPQVLSDTLTLDSNASVNGRITYTGGIFEVTGEYRNDKGEIVTNVWRVHRTRVKKLEFNQTYFNPGDPSTYLTGLEKVNWWTKPFLDPNETQHASTSEYDHIFSKVIDPGKVDAELKGEIDAFFVRRMAIRKTPIDNVSEAMKALDGNPRLKSRVMSCLQESAIDTILLRNETQRKGVLVQIDKQTVQLLENEKQVDLRAQGVKVILVGR